MGIFPLCLWFWTRSESDSTSHTVGSWWTCPFPHCQSSSPAWGQLSSRFSVNCLLGPGLSVLALSSRTSHRKSRKLRNPKLNVPWWVRDDIGITTGHAIFYLSAILSTGNNIHDIYFFIFSLRIYVISRLWVRSAFPEMMKFIERLILLWRILTKR